MTQFGDRIEAPTRDIVAPRTQQVNVSIQQEAPLASLLEVAYVTGERAEADAVRQEGAF